MKNKIFDIFNLHEGEDDKARTLERVTKEINFTGANIWILACAILVASVGLNVNSAAVIIGAMLISPLMGPIVGAGFALGIYDFDLLKTSLRNLAIATIVSLAVSTLYFFLSPFKDVQSELLARTTPNIYDILIAFFGGIVGAIAITRVEKGNPIPGVAIATALMPPLCTAGYGLATANWAYFLGAFYLYCINCVFIGIATFAIIKFLKYPAKKMVNPTQQKRVRQVITWLTIIMLLPSSYLAYNLYREQEFRKRTEQFLDREFTQKGDVIVYRKTYVGKKPKRVELAFLSQRFEPEEIAALNAKLEKAVDERVELVIRQDSTDRLTALKGDIMNEIKHTTLLNTSKDVKIASLQQQITSNTFETKQILSEAEALFPTIAAMSIANHSFTQANDSTFAETVVIIDINGAFSNTERSRFSNWLTKRLAVKKISVYTR
ncbi:MAG: DUF389 domain-containing protein [Flavobacterium sp.]|nr:DUF389 domain-containing protein [Flavobacterium sp.]